MSIQDVAAARAPVSGSVRFDLAITASRAALSLESRMRSSGASIEPVKELVKVLRANTTPPGQAGKAALVNVESTALWVRAFQLRPGMKLETLADVLTAADVLLSKLEGVSEKSSAELLALLRDECLRISDAAQIEIESPFRMDYESSLEQRWLN